MATQAAPYLKKLSMISGVECTMRLKNNKDELQIDSLAIGDTRRSILHCMRRRIPHVADYAGLTILTIN